MRFLYWSRDRPWAFSFPYKLYVQNKPFLYFALKGSVIFNEEY